MRAICALKNLASSAIADRATPPSGEGFERSGVLLLSGTCGRHAELLPVPYFHVVFTMPAPIVISYLIPVQPSML
jgi:hypothetical protein